ncbi:MAG: pyrroline-5-carboxylate reductase [Candidatus Omnitrophota bacterium]
MKGGIGIIGCGNMGGAIARGIASHGSISLEEVYLYDLDASKAEKLAYETGCRHGDILQMARGSQILVLAVKPADFKALAKEISSDIIDQTVVSVMAAVRTKDIVSILGKDIAVVRAMPNLAASVRRSVTCLYFNEKAAGNGTGLKVREIFSGIGEVLDVKESEMDIVTAISGSGPAYLFSLAEAMVKSARDEGLSEDTAVKIVSGTLSGASILLEKSDRSAGELIKMVASKGGTTEAALSVFASGGFENIVKKAVLAAKKRSAEMSGGEKGCSC